MKFIDFIMIAVATIALVLCLCFAFICISVLDIKNFILFGLLSLGIMYLLYLNTCMGSDK